MTGITRGQRPDLTPAQLVGVALAGVPVLATLLRAFGVYDVSLEQQQALQDTVTWGGVLGGVLFASDAGLRAARNHADARRDAAALSAPTSPHALPEIDEEDEADDAAIDDAELDSLLGPHSSTVPDAPEDLR